MTTKIEQMNVKSNGVFGIIDGPKEVEDFWKNVSLRITVVNFSSGEVCDKKVGENTKGLHFRHSGQNRKTNGTYYLADFTETVLYVPFQIIKVNSEE